MLDKNKHHSLLVQILRDIYSDSRLGALLGFKGGTAALLIYNLPRFSVDLDFDLLDPTKEEYVFEKLTDIISKYSHLTQKHNKRYTLFWMGSYIPGLRQIKIEISKRPEPANYEIRSYLGFSLLVIKPEDMFANKLIALSERKKFAARDLFDIWYFLKNNWEISSQIITRHSGTSVKKYLGQSLKFVKKVDSRDILSGLGELLEPKMKDWARQNLKKDTEFLLRLRLSLES